MNKDAILKLAISAICGLLLLIVGMLGWHLNEQAEHNDEQDARLAEIEREVHRNGYALDRALEPR